MLSNSYTANLKIWDNVQHFKTRFVFEKHGPYEKNSINKIILFLILQWYRKISFKLVYWRQIYGILEENYFWFRMILVYSKCMTNMKKSSSEKQFYILSFDTIFFGNLLAGWKVENLRYITPIFIAPTYVRVYFQLGPYFFIDV